ncbi:MAG: spore coat protein [Treponema sp.]|jgi:spore coat polysaccharide biosynthesis protein SpsF|nr:spore coat protein [Treponema sp.]
MTAVVLQARLDSRRLYGKSLLLLGGRPLVFRVMEALNCLKADLRILACPEDCTAAFSPLAEEAGFELVAGPKEDVLARFCIAVRQFKMERIIRATGDNPFVFIDAAEALNTEAEALGADYAGYAGIPHGSGVESVTSEALLRAERESESPQDREHVCPYLYARPELFLLHRPLAPVVWQDPAMRLTVDTPEDFSRAEALYRGLTETTGGQSPGDERPARYRGKTIRETCRRIRGKSAGAAPVGMAAVEPMV